MKEENECLSPVENSTESNSYRPVIFVFVRYRSSYTSLMPCFVSKVFCIIRLYVKSQNPFEISFKLKLCSFISVPSLFKKEINAFNSFGIE